MLFGNYQKMSGIDRMYIQKRHKSVSFPYEGVGDLFCDYFAKNAIFHMCWRGESNPYDLAIAGT